MLPGLKASLFATAVLMSLHSGVTQAAEKPKVSVLVAGQSHGVIMRRMNGIGFNPADKMIYATTTTSETVYKVNPKTGDVTIAVPPPMGEGDDLAAAPDGSMAWTGLATGRLFYKSPKGKAVVLDADVPGINPVAFDKNGRLVAAQANLGHALYEFYPGTQKPKRLILQTKDTEDLNSFGFGPNGLLYSPQRPDKLVEIDIDKGTLRVVADKMGGATRVEADGHVIAIARDNNLMRVDPATGKAEVIANLGLGSDGLTIGDDGTIYVATPGESSIRAIDPKSGAIRDVVRGHFSALGGLAMIEKDGREILFAGDPWGFRDVDTVTGEVKKLTTRGLRAGGSSDIAVGDKAIATSNGRLGVVQKLDRTTEKVEFENTTIKMPYGVALLDDGAVAVADFIGKRIAHVDASGATTLADGFQGPVGLARAKDGALLVTDAYAGTLSSVDPKTGKRTEIAKGLKGPEGLAVMADGRIAVAETGAGRLVAVDAKSGKRETLADKLPFGSHVTATADKVGLAAGVAVGKDGSVYVSCDGDFSIRKVTVAAK